jgi:glycosyltransferase involved in cell wall biosynthesis
MTKISYVTSAYNSEPFLDGLFRDLLTQTEEDFEHIIVDSASTDRTVEITKEWMGRDSRIKLIAQPSRTPYGVSWLTGWQQAGGDIVCNTNSDDRSYPWRGTQVLSHRDQARGINDDKHFYYGGYETRVGNIVTAKGHPPPYTEGDLQRFFRCGIHVHWDNSLRHVVDWEKMMKAAYEYTSAFDYWLVLYFMSLGATGVSIPSCFSIYNQRPDSLEQSDKELSSFEGLRAITTFYPAGPVNHDLQTKTRVESPEYYARFQEFLKQFGE